MSYCQTCIIYLVSVISVFTFARALLQKVWDQEGRGQTRLDYNSIKPLKTLYCFTFPPNKKAQKQEICMCTRVSKYIFHRYIYKE